MGQSGATRRSLSPAAVARRPTLAVELRHEPFVMPRDGDEVICACDRCSALGYGDRTVRCQPPTRASPARGDARSRHAGAAATNLATVARDGTDLRHLTTFTGGDLNAFCRQLL